MPTGEIIVASAALIGALGSQYLSYHFKRRKERSEAEREFYNNVIQKTDKIIYAYETYLDDYEVGSEIPYSNASRAKNRMQPQAIRKENFNKPSLAPDSLIDNLQELQAICWEIDDLDMPARNQMDPYTGKIAKEYMDTINQFYSKANEINQVAVNQRE